MTPTPLIYLGLVRVWQRELALDQKESKMKDWKERYDWKGKCNEGTKEKASKQQ